MLAFVAALALGAQPAHLHLLEKRLVLAQAPLAPPAPIGPNTPPPLVEPPPAPMAPPPSAEPTSRVVTPAGPQVVQAAPPRDLHLLDVHKGSIAGGEVVIGALGAFGLTAATTLGAVALLDSCPSTCSDSATGSTLALWFLSWYVLEPLVVSGMEAWMGGTPRAGSIGKSVGFGFAVEGLGLLVGIIVAVASPVAGALVLLAGQWVAVPLAASLGLHFGDAAPGPDDAPPVGLDAVLHVGPGR